MSLSTEKTLSNTEQTIRCQSCGGGMTYKPGTDFLICNYCDSEQRIEKKETILSKSDYLSTLIQMDNASEKQELHTVACSACTAVVTMKAHVVADFCPYCGTNLIVENATSCSVLKPDYVLPFEIDEKTAKSAYSKWIRKLWFAPNDLKRVNNPEKLQGIYLPYWSYDTQTSTYYSGEQGYIDLRMVSLGNLKGNGYRQLLPQISWKPAHGTITSTFSDILIPATHSLNQTMLNKLMPWDVQKTAAFNEAYIAGYRTEAYSVNLQQGFSETKQQITKNIHKSIRKKIGGILQKINSTNTDYEHIQFKHLLLPLWISSYRYQGKIYHFTINAQTGKVSGERPYSMTKISLAALGVVLIIGLLVFLFVKLKPSQFNVF